MEVENKTIPGPKWRPILLLKSMEAENIFLTLCPQGWIQIGESHWEVARESREGFSPSAILATPRMRDSPIWIQPRGVFRFNPTPGS